MRDAAGLAGRWVSASLALNVAVLIPVCGGLALDADWAVATYGADTAARDILLSVYAAILAASLFLLVRPDPSRVATLLALQIAYKLMTPLAVGTVLNPAVASNLLIAAVHAVTLTLLLRETAATAPAAGKTNAPR